MSSASTLPPAAESRQGLDIVEQDFDREALSPVSVLLTWEGAEGIDMSRAAGLFLYGQEISQIPGVASVLSPFTLEGLSQEGLAEGGLADPRPWLRSGLSSRVCSTTRMVSRFPPRG